MSPTPTLRSFYEAIFVATLYTYTHKELLEKRDCLMVKDPIKNIKNIEGNVRMEEKLATSSYKKDLASVLMLKAKL